MNTTPLPASSASGHAACAISVPATPTARLLGLDAARVLATLGVVWFHSIESDDFRPSGVLGRFSVAFYTIAAMVFLIDSAGRRQRPYPAYVLDRLRRLYLPFLGWSAITLIAMAINDTCDGGAVHMPPFSWNMLVDGGSLHLWYIPFLFVASALVYPIARWMQGGARRKWLVAIGCLLIALLLDGNMLGTPQLSRIPVLSYFFEVTAERWSAVYWGVAAAIFWISGLSRSGWRTPLAAIGLLLLIATTAWQWQFGVVAQLKVYGGLGLLLAALAPWQNWLVRFLAPYGRMSAGVYFAHMAAIYLMRAWVAAYDAAQGGWARDVAVFIGAIILSFAAIALLSLIPGLQWLAGYDGSAMRRRVSPQPTTAN